MIMTRKGVERAVRYAFDLTRKRNKRKKLTLIDKANADRCHGNLDAHLRRGRRRSIRTSSATTPTSMRPACGW